MNDTEDLIPTCDTCGRERDPIGRPADVNNYNPFQAITGRPFGWYSGSDGEICPEDMERIIRGGGLS